MCDRGSGSLYSNPGDNPHRRLAVRRGFPVLCPALGFAQQPRRKCEPAMNSPRPGAVGTSQRVRSAMGGARVDED